MTTRAYAYPPRVFRIGAAFALTLALLAPAGAQAAAFVWGSNNSGELGDNTTTSRSAPVAVADANNVLTGVTLTQISAGGSHSCAVSSSGKAYCWGNGSSGQLGDNTGIQSNAPIAVVDANNVLTGETLTQISAGSSHSCALSSSGKAYCWGKGDSGQLGDNTATSRSAPVAVVDANNVLTGVTLTRISAGSSHSCALSSSGKAYCWGNSSRGQLGDNTTTQRNAPVAVVDRNNVLTGETLTQISAGGSHSCAVSSSGKAYCWGDGTSGQLGDNGATRRNAPVAVVDANNVLTGETLTQISAGSSHSCAVSSSGKAYCWGSGGSGRLGDNTATQRNAPVAVVDANNVLSGEILTQINAGGSHSCALSSSGNAYCWGRGTDGRLGNNATLQRNAPVAVVDANNVLSGNPLTQISIGNSSTHTVALAAVAVVNGACGTASGSTATAAAPATGLCATGTATTVAGNNNGKWNWDCTGSGGGTTTTGLTCSAPYAAQTLTITADPSGIALNGTSTVTGSSTSGLPPALSSTTTDACTLGASSGSVQVTASVTGINAGTCTVKVNHAGTGDNGDSRYLVATEKTVDITVNKANQSINFGSAPTVAVDGTGTVTAGGGGSGNAVSFSDGMSASCSVSGSTVTGLKAGTDNCTIFANQLGNANYNAAPQAMLTFSIGKGAQSITNFTAPASLSVKGSSSLSATKGASSSAVIFSSKTTDICTVSGSTVTAIAAGTCTVAANQAADANYNVAAEVTKDLTVGKGGQTITFNAAPSVVVDGTGTVSATSSAGGNVSFSSTTPGVCTVSGITVTGVSAGTCTIAGNQAGNDDYEAAPQALLTFSIGMGTQILSFGSAPTVVVDGAGTVSATSDKGLTTTYSSDTPAECSVSGSTVTGIKAGINNCTIKATQAGSGDYNAGTQTQTFSIGKGAQAITLGAAPTVVANGTGTVSAATFGASANGVTFSTGSSTCSVTSSGTVTGVTSGSCTVTANQLGNDNYEAAPQVTQTFSVGKGGQSITNFTAPVSLTVGGTTATLSATKGVSSSTMVFSSKNTDVCTVAGSTVTAVAAGTCTVAANQAGDANYNAASEVTRDITVNAAPATPVHGSCGTDNGITTATAPAANLCTAGAASTVTDSGTSFSWSCAGTDGGTTATCAAMKSAATTTSGAPTGLFATAGDSKVTVSFLPPSNNGGATISNYRFSTDGGATFAAFSPAITTSPVVITGLVNGTTYSIKIQAVNSAGNGTASDAVSVTPTSEVDADGVADSTETPVPSATGFGGATGDGNGDGIADSTQSNVTSLPTASGTYATVAVAGTGITLSNVVATATPVDFPGTVSASLSGLAFTVNGVTAGASQEIDLYFPSSSGVSGLVKRNLRTGAFEVLPTTHALIGNKIRLRFTLTDGGDFDADRTVNGSIQDPVFPFAAGGGGGGGGKGGALGWLTLLPLGMAALRRRYAHT